MANSLRHVLLIATVVTATILAGFCEAQSNPASSENDVPPPGSQGQGGSSPGVIPVPIAKPGESGRVDVNNQPVTGGLASFITPMASPITWTIYEVLDFFLTNFIGQKLPCTVWSLTPPKVACSNLEGPSA